MTSLNTGFVSPLTTARHQELAKQGRGIDQQIKVKGLTQTEKTEKLSEREKAVSERTARNGVDPSKQLNTRFNKGQIMLLKAKIDQVGVSDVQARSYNEPNVVSRFFSAMIKGDTYVNAGKALIKGDNWVKVGKTVGSGFITAVKGLGKGLFFLTNIVRVPLSQTIRLFGIGATEGSNRQKVVDFLWKGLHTKSEASALTFYKESTTIFSKANEIELTAKKTETSLAALNQEMSSLDTQIQDLQSPLRNPAYMNLIDLQNRINHILKTAKEQGIAPNPNTLNPLHQQLESAQKKFDSQINPLKAKLSELKTEQLKKQVELSEQKQVVSELRTIATRIRAGDTIERALYVASFTQTGGSAVNFTALSSQAAQQGHSLDQMIQTTSEMVAGKGDPIISQATLGALGIAGGAFTMASEAYDMYQTGKKLSAGLERRTQVQTALKFEGMSKGEQLLDIDKDKNKLIQIRVHNKTIMEAVPPNLSDFKNKTDFEVAVKKYKGTLKEIKKEIGSSDFAELKKMYGDKPVPGLNQAILDLSAKIEEATTVGDTKTANKLTKLQMNLSVKKGELHYAERDLTNDIDFKEKMMTEGLSDKAKAVLHQVDNRVDKKFKILKMIRNVVGMAAGAAAVAVGLVAVGAIVAAAVLTPIGWGLAGAALVGAVGFGIYGAVKSSSRAAKAAQAVDNHKQIALKRNELQVNYHELKHTLATAEKYMAYLNGDPTAAIGISDDKLKKLDEGKGKLESANTKVKELQAQLQEKPINPENVTLSPERELQSRAILGGSDSPKMQALYKEQLEADLKQAQEELTGVERELGINVEEIQHAISEVTASLSTLEELDSQNTLQMLAADPKTARETLLEGVKKGDPEMTYIMEDVLGIKLTQIEGIDEIMAKDINKAFSMHPGG